MKKNLRIVSAAAAALLAVAPVAATAIATPATTATVQAADTYNAGNMNVTLKGNQDAKFANVQDQVAKQLGDALGTKVTLEKVNAGEVNNNKQTVTFQVKNADSTNAAAWAYGKVNFNGNATPYYWAGNANDSKNRAMVVSAASSSHSDIDAGTPATFTATINYTKSASSADSSSTSINAGAASIFNADANTSVTINATAKNGNIPSAVNGSVSVSLDGKNFDALLHDLGSGKNANIYSASDLKNPVDATDLTPGLYWAELKDVTVNLGNSYAGKTETFTLSRGNFANTMNNTQKVTVNSNGVADLGKIWVPFYAYDATDMRTVNFYAKKTGEVVTSGSVTLHARNDGMLNVESVYNALNFEYGASQYIDGKADSLMTVNDIRDQLKKANISVDANGYFKAPASFSLNMNAKSNVNGATATLPVTVNVDNAQVSSNTQETTKTVTIMHISTVYDKNGKATTEPALRAYDTYSVVSEPVTINGAKFYKLAGKDQYIKVGNVDGTSRTLKKNSYVYKSSGKRANKKTLKKGSSVTTYGKSFMIAGSQMYRIGKNQYVKKANF